jgi:hypothetical protein
MRAWPFQLRRLPISAAQVVQSPLLKRCQATVTVDANVEQVPRTSHPAGEKRSASIMLVMPRSNFTSKRM